MDPEKGHQLKRRPPKGGSHKTMAIGDNLERRYLAENVFRNLSCHRKVIMQAQAMPSLATPRGMDRTQ